MQSHNRHITTSNSNSNHFITHLRVRYYDWSCLIVRVHIVVAAVFKPDIVSLVTQYLECGNQYLRKWTLNVHILPQFFIVLATILTTLKRIKHILFDSVITIH